jgi:hypothetical protein
MPALPASGHADHEAVYCASCNIYRDPGMTKILMGVRRPVPASPRHPGVLSTPTMRLPRQVFESVTRPLEVESGVVVLDEQPVRRTGPGSFQHVETFVVESLMARKLGLGDALMTGRVRARVTTTSVAVDHVADPLGSGLSELTHMISWSVVLEAGADLVPSATSAYAPLLWADTERVREAMRAKDALIVDDTLNPFEVCIDGLCVRSAVVQLDRISRR